MKAHWLALLWWTLLVPGAVHAQPAEVEERLRVRTTDGARFSATLIEITPSDLGLRRDDDDVRIPLAQVRTLERSLGERRRVARNFLITTGVGALAIGALLAVTDSGRCNDQPLGCLDAGGSFIVGFIAGGIVSAPIGLVVGLTVRGGRRERRRLPPLAGVSGTLAPMRAGRVSLGASVPLGR